MPKADYYFTNIKPDPIEIPPCIEKKDTTSTQQQQAEDPIEEDLPPLRPGETHGYPSAIATNKTPALDLTNTTITSESDLYTAFHSLNLCSTKIDHNMHGREETNPK